MMMSPSKNGDHCSKKKEKGKDRYVHFCRNYRIGTLPTNVGNNMSLVSFKRGVRSWQYSDYLGTRLKVIVPKPSNVLTG